MELALDQVPLRVEVLFLATVLGVLALFAIAVRAAAERTEGSGSLEERVAVQWFGQKTPPGDGVGIACIWRAGGH